MVVLLGASEYAQPKPWLTVKVCPATVIVPLLSAPLFGETENVTVPLPELLPPAVIEIHESLLAAVQLQPAPLVTVMLPLPPPAGMLVEVEDNTYVQPDACVTVKVCPAAIIVPVRAASLFAATEKFTVPLPLPLPPEVIVIHESLLAAVHEQPVPEMMLKLPAAPLAGTLVLAADKVYVQPDACVTVNVCPAIVNVPVRAVPGFAATVKLTVPLLVPLAPAVTVIHDALLAAVQAQPAPLVIFTLPLPPVSLKPAVVAESE